MLTLTGAFWRKRYIELKRYPLNTVSELVVIYGFFLLLFFGIRIFSSGNVAGSDGTSSEIIVGYLMWVWALTAFQLPSQQLAEEAAHGTLEQLYMSPYGFRWIMAAQTSAQFAYSCLIIGLLWLMVTLTSGRRLHLDLASLLPLILASLVGIYGVGIALGGLALVFKRISSLLQLMNFGIIALIAIPIQQFPLMTYLPLSLGTHLISEVAVGGTSLLQI